MFHDIPEAMLARMRELEARDRRDRTDGTPRMERLRQISPEVGRLLAILAAGAPEGPCIEIGTSAGYSTMWLALACRERGRKVKTFEILPAKVELVQGDALEHLTGIRGIGFCFLDCEKEIYGRCYEEVVPRMVAGGILVADNAINHRQALEPMLDRALSDERVDALIVPIGNGELICRRR